MISAAQNLQKGKSKDDICCSKSTKSQKGESKDDICCSKSTKSESKDDISMLLKIYKKVSQKIISAAQNLQNGE